MTIKVFFLLTLFATLNQSPSAQSEATLGDLLLGKTTLLAENIKRIKIKVWRVESKDGEFQGSGFSINRYGDIITCAHVAKERDTLYFHNSDPMDSTYTQCGSMRVRAHKLISRPNIDFAVFHVDSILTGGDDSISIWKRDSALKNPLYAFFAIQDSRTLREGQNVALVAFIPEPFSVVRPFVSTGIISVIRNHIYNDELKNYVDLVQLDLTASYGTSGGAVIDVATGNLIAIQNSGLFSGKGVTNTPYPIALTANQFLPLLDSLKIPYARAEVK